ncbi:unnamed protein product [Cuscuta europaea]|uniref:Auxin-responsive protein n=1 Tax=Cuscuta europaea TaxID=41803 RepID=A0A9P1EGJ5_CUSEU|nr:unnamed protein product [Cuscuta europaea]
MVSPSTLGEGHCNASSVMASSSAILKAKDRLNLKATELRLGLPGSQSSDRDEEVNNNDLKPGKFNEKTLFPLLPSNEGICSPLKASGNKRGFLETKVALVTQANNWMFTTPKSDSQANMKDKHVQAKEQVVGWPPIRSFRKNTLTSSAKVNDEVDGKPGPMAIFVKVSMDGAPYLRKVDLRTYTSYQELSAGLEKMFSCFTIEQCESPQGGQGRENLSESMLRDCLHGSEYVVTYEDKDGDWMLVGDVPWDMFIESCKRLKIMKGSDAIGLAPRAMEKSKSYRN